MMIKSSDVHPGDVIQARDRATIVEDLRTLDQRIIAQEAINGPGAWQNCRNCLSDVFFWGLGEVTADLGSDTYTLKPKYISNTNSTTTDAMTTADMNVATGIKPAITATAVGTGTVTVADEFLVFGGFDAGEDADEPIVRYFFECRGGAAAWTQLTESGLSHRTATHFAGMYEHYDGAALHTAHAYYAWEVDGAGDAVRQESKEGKAIVLMCSNKGSGYIDGAGTVRGDYKIAAVTEIFDPTNVDFAAPPTVANENLWDQYELYSDGANAASITFPGTALTGTASVIPPPMGDPLYGIRLTLTLGTYVDGIINKFEYWHTTDGTSNPPQLWWLML